MTIKTYNIQTSLGQLTPWKDKLDFLSESQIEEFNKIGYTGKNSAGQECSYQEYLNTLQEGQFEVRTTKINRFDFSEELMIIRVTP